MYGSRLRAAEHSDGAAARGDLYRGGVTRPRRLERASQLAPVVPSGQRHAPRTHAPVPEQLKGHASLGSTTSQPAPPQPASLYAKLMHAISYHTPLELVVVLALIVLKHPRTKKPPKPGLLDRDAPPLASMPSTGTNKFLQDSTC